MVTVLDTIPPKARAGCVDEGARTPWPRANYAVVTATEPLVCAVLRAFDSACAGVGPAGAAAEFPLVELPEPPAFVQTSYTESVVVVEWPPSGGFLGSLFDHPLGPEDIPLDEALEPIVTAPPVATGASVAESPSSVPPVPPGPVRYNV